MWFNRVVFPAPRKPDSNVTGTVVSALCCSATAAAVELHLEVLGATPTRPPVAAGAAAAHASAASGATGGRHGAVENEEHRMLLRNPPAATRPLAAHRAPHISLPLVDERHRPQTAAPRGQDSGDRRQLG